VANVPVGRRRLLILLVITALVLLTFDQRGNRVIDGARTGFIGVTSPLRSLARVAASPARIWSDICATNADQILPALDRLIATLEEMRTHLTDGGVDPLFESARRWRGRIRS